MAMSNGNSFWKCLEAGIGGAAPEAAWREALGDCYPQASRYLVPEPALATHVACDRTRLGGECRYRIVAHAGGVYAGVCDEGHCARREFTREELVRYAVNDARLLADIAQGLGLEATISGVDGLDAAHVLAQVRGRGGVVVPVIFTRSRTPEDFLAKAKELLLKYLGPFVVLVPTLRRVAPEASDLLARRGAKLFGLDALLVLRDSGIVGTSEGREAVADCLEALAEPDESYIPDARGRALAGCRAHVQGQPSGDRAGARGAAILHVCGDGHGGRPHKRAGPPVEPSLRLRTRGRLSRLVEQGGAA